jgi:hypothetical protein
VIVVRNIESLFFSVLDVYAAHIYSHHFSEELITRSIVNSVGFGIRYVVNDKMMNWKSCLRKRA